MLFREQSGEASPAQIRAFIDTWEWTQEAERTFEQEIVTNPGTPANVTEMISAFRQFIGNNAMMAYLVMMTPRLVELRRVLKPTGSIYLHCDPTASHYLKLLMDTIFGPEFFQNDIIWKRTSGHSDARRYGRVHDVLLYYTLGTEAKWNVTYQPYEDDYVNSTTVTKKWTGGDGCLTTSARLGSRAVDTSTSGMESLASGVSLRKR